MHYLDNLLLNTDSYKASHWLQYPPGTDATFFYVESRGGHYDRTLFFGLQAILKDYLAKPITHADIDVARDLFAAHGEPFNEAGWRYIVDTHGGLMPIRIRAVPEGSVVPVHNALMTIESTDPQAFWVPSYLETMLLRVWYPVTVATTSWHAKQTICQYLERTSDDPEGQLPFKLHDFGSRGVSSLESAAIGGAAHLVNFLGTDTVSALLFARAFYNEAMAGYSIPAAEHSTITSWGRDNEVEAYRNMLARFATPGALVAVVSDSYDIFHAITRHWGTTLRQQVIDSGATVVIRPDSGDPVAVVLQCLQLLDDAFGHVVNGKGYKVLNHVRVIQGDGVNPTSIGQILASITAAGYAADNVAFGMGGALLQRLDRDTQKFALKCSAARVEGKWIDVYKDPVTDSGKQSKRGRMRLLRHREYGQFRTVSVPADAESLTAAALPLGYEDAMVTVWENGRLLQDDTLADIRSRANAARP
ncbi:nicotinate phosphoribosyltransferase [Stenotrophomonas rhizophila]|uniref:nicotinate phosphoribosyltransferase n=1 Tax=Stenotrophomonas rhizophila TaxID=216778 RepID=UPI001E65B129|nr:nicotinate phosphoribosyltransferase [Stenotrophomonas rhizophila]MCC7633097.1 nicotinate phosphoribosyltransferase [Stenotrophomonas rhizophila]MCC7661990.1 nicotinate phosphoribosyltransferase [Stenotrophomonas rhizophila]